MAVIAPLSHSLFFPFLASFLLQPALSLSVSRLSVGTVASMDAPVQIFREELDSTCIPGPCRPPSTSSSWPLAWVDYDSNATGTFGETQHNHTSISPSIPIIITAVYSVVFVVGLVGNSLVMFVIIR